MPRRRGAILFTLLAVSFLIVNRGAYQGYFRDDEIDNLSWTRYGSAFEYVKGALTPRFFENNFRPVGHFYFHAAERVFGLDFPKYVAVLQVFHLMNVWLVWAVSRRLGTSARAAAAGAIFFAFHMALFDAFWKPMYVFDVLCAGLCLGSLLLYMHRRWVLSFVAFWLAYKAKELAVMLPLALVCYEMWFGKRRWMRLAPWFAASLSFGLQGIFMNPNRDNDYTFRFTPAALLRTSVFYSARLFLVPYAGFVLPLAAWISRNRRTWFGLAMMTLFFVPLLFLPGRMANAYCYVPFTGLAIALTGIAETASPAAVLLFFLLWIPQDLHWLRTQRSETLARASEVREWMGTLAAFAKTAPAVDEVVYSGHPTGFAGWGVEGAVKYLFNRGDLKISEGSSAGPSASAILLDWDPVRKKLDITRGAAP